MTLHTTPHSQGINADLEVCHLRKGHRFCLGHFFGNLVRPLKHHGHASFLSLTFMSDSYEHVVSDRMQRGYGRGMEGV